MTDDVSDLKKKKKIVAAFSDQQYFPWLLLQMSFLISNVTTCLQPHLDHNHKTVPFHFLLQYLLITAASWMHACAHTFFFSSLLRAAHVNVGVLLEGWVCLALNCHCPNNRHWTGGVIWNFPDIHTGTFLLHDKTEPYLCMWNKQQQRVCVGPACRSLACMEHWRAQREEVCGQWFELWTDEISAANQCKVKALLPLVMMSHVDVKCALSCWLGSNVHRVQDPGVGGVCGTQPLPCPAACSATCGTRIDNFSLWLRRMWRRTVDEDTWRYWSAVKRRGNAGDHTDTNPVGAGADLDCIGNEPSRFLSGHVLDVFKD